MSQYQFRKTIVFIAFAAEEYGLFGSGLYAQDAAARHDRIEALFNNDIIGSDVTGNGETNNRYVNVFSEDPNDSPSRQVARYMKSAAERYQPGFEINLVFRHDRFGRAVIIVPSPLWALPLSASLRPWKTSATSTQPRIPSPTPHPSTRHWSPRQMPPESLNWP